MSIVVSGLRKSHSTYLNTKEFNISRLQQIAIPNHDIYSTTINQIANLILATLRVLTWIQNICAQKGDYG